jgi:hypothetical protein
MTKGDKKRESSLSSHLGQRGTVCPPWISHSIEVNFSGFACIRAALIIADLVNDEQQVDKVAYGTEFLISSVGIGVRHEKFVATLDKESTLSVSEDVVAVDPGARLGGGFPVVGVGGPLEGLRESEKIWEIKGLEC